MILLTNGDSWTQGDSPSQTINWNATKSLDWYDIIPHFGDESNLCNKTILVFVVIVVFSVQNTPYEQKYMQSEIEGDV